MNYAKFYSTAEKTLIDSLVTMWIPGRKREQDYMRYVLKDVEPLMAEPVIQSIFPWEGSRQNFEQHASERHLLDADFVDALSDEGMPEDFRFPKERKPFRHQTASWEAMLNSKKTIVVTSGTGSGKTECFTVPVLQDLYRADEKGAVQAIFLYPLNALMKSQQERIDAWCRSLPEKVTYAIYNGATEKEDWAVEKTAPYYPRLITRPQIRKTPPQILFTNPTMLNYMLVRSEDRPIISQSQGKLKWILLDEAHTYTGSAAAELALQLRRVIKAFGVRPEDVNFAVTSATMGDPGDPDTTRRLKEYVSQLTGKDVADIEVIDGKRIVPDLDRQAAEREIKDVNRQFGTHLDFKQINQLRKELNDRPVLKCADVVKGYLGGKFKNDRLKTLEVLDRLGEKVDGLLAGGDTGALLPTRMHFFIRSLGGMYACANPDCTRHQNKRIDLGSLTTRQNTKCSECGSNLLEIGACPSCGELMLAGEESTSKGFRLRRNIQSIETDLFYNNVTDDAEEVADGVEVRASGADEDEDVYMPFYYAKPGRITSRKSVQVYERKFDFTKNKFVAPGLDEQSPSIVYGATRRDKAEGCYCPHCGTGIMHLNYFRASASFMGRLLSSLILDNAEPMNSQDADILYEGRKYITFTDNRQGSARSAMGLNQDVERAWVRSAIFHRLADARLDDVPVGGLTDEDKEDYEWLLGQGNNLTPRLKRQLEALKAKAEGVVEEPRPKAVSWSDIKDGLETDASFEKMYRHLNSDFIKDDGFVAKDKVDYLRSLYIMQFGYIPKRANSLETMGLVKLVYPQLQNEQSPVAAISDEEWRNFLKICIDYVIRSGSHYQISESYSCYLTEAKYARCIYPAGCKLKRGDKRVKCWPSLAEGLHGQVMERQSRIVLLLCAALGVTDADSITQTQKDTIGLALRSAWKTLTDKVLTISDSDNHGYLLDLFSMPRMELITDAWLCPVDNVVVDTTFMGYSPRISGYINADNFNEYKVKRSLHYPMFPFRSNALGDNDVNAWIDASLTEQQDCGLVSGIMRMIYNSHPVYISAEHSGQQSRSLLEKFEDLFKAGKLNILSCSTTMEAGVDIGGLSEVVMNNVPPKAANYLQRAGRAGRRSESKSLALTFCAPNPIGNNTFKNPDWPITHITEMPSVKLESVQLVQRHVNAMLFAFFIRRDDLYVRVSDDVKSFFLDNAYDNFLAYLDTVSNGSVNVDKENDTYEALVRKTVLESVPLADAALEACRCIMKVKKVFDSRLHAIDTDIQNALANAGNGATANRQNAINRKRESYVSQNLLVYLAENGFIPTSGMPTGLVECDLNGGINKKSESPTMHLSQAISAFAPGCQIVKNEWVYEPAGVHLKTAYDDNTKTYAIQCCDRCGYTAISYGDHATDCPKCGHQGSMHGIRNMRVGAQAGRFTEVIEPAGFTVDFESKPVRSIKYGQEANFIQPLLLEMNPWPDNTSHARLLMRTSTPESEILFYNKASHQKGYAYCPICGRMKAEVSVDDTENPLQMHTHLETGRLCDGGKDGGRHIHRHVLLIGRYQTDFVELRFFGSDDKQITDLDTLYSLGVVLSRKLTEVLGVNDGEIDFGLNAVNHSVFIYDTALGGAGYSTLLPEYMEEVLNKVYESLSSCNCEKACTHCLIDRKSQWYINYLDRKKALEWILLERDSRTAPQEVLGIRPQSSTVTIDVDTQISRIIRQPDLSGVRFFVDSDYENWDFDNFRFGRTLEELAHNRQASLVVDRDMDVDSMSAKSMMAVLPAVFRYKFFVGQKPLDKGYLPLAEVSYNHGERKLIFGKDADKSVSRKWGDGQLYISSGEAEAEYRSIDGMDIVSRFVANANRNIFAQFHLTNATLNSQGLFDLVCSETNKYNSRALELIKAAFDGKDVEVEYTDKYVCTPLGCMLLAQFLSAMKGRLHLNFRSLVIHVIDVYNSNPEWQYRTLDEIFVDQNFPDSDTRDVYLRDMVRANLDMNPIVQRSRELPHERCFTVKSAEGAELCIRPDGGIARGWKPSQRFMRPANLSAAPCQNLPMFNDEAQQGLLYYVIFKSAN